MADPFSLTTGIISLLTLAIKLVAGAAGLIDKSITAHREATNELQALEWDLERLDTQMDQIHDKLQFLATDTKDRAFKKLLQNKRGKRAIWTLCGALDETYTILKRLTDRAESEKSNLQSIALPANEKSLAYVQAILRQSFSPSTVADLVSNLQSMQFEIRACLEKLDNSFRHVQDFYNFTNNRLERISTSTSGVSTSTMLTARINLAGWLERRERIWKLSSRSTSTNPDHVIDTDHLSRIPSGILDRVQPLPVYHTQRVYGGWANAQTFTALLTVPPPMTDGGPAYNEFGLENGARSPSANTHNVQYFPPPFAPPSVASSAPLSPLVTSSAPSIGRFAISTYLSADEKKNRLKATLSLPPVAAQSFSYPFDSPFIALPIEQGTPPVRSNGWLSAAEEKKQIYEKAKADAERALRRAANMSSGGSTKPSPKGSQFNSTKDNSVPMQPAAARTTSPAHYSSDWLSAEEEKKRLYEKAQAIARLGQARALLGGSPTETASSSTNKGIIDPYTYTSDPSINSGVGGGQATGQPFAAPLTASPPMTNGSPSYNEFGLENGALSPNADTHNVQYSPPPSAPPSVASSAPFIGRFAISNLHAGDELDLPPPAPGARGSYLSADEQKNRPRAMLRPGLPPSFSRRFDAPIISLPMEQGTPPVRSNGWLSAAEEKKQIYEKAKADAERALRRAANMSSGGSTKPSPKGSQFNSTKDNSVPMQPAAARTTSPAHYSSDWLSAEEEKKRLYEKAQAIARLRQARALLGGSPTETASSSTNKGIVDPYTYTPDPSINNGIGGGQATAPPFAAPLTAAPPLPNRGYDAYWALSPPPQPYNPPQVYASPQGVINGLQLASQPPLWVPGSPPPFTPPVMGYTAESDLPEKEKIKPAFARRDAMLEQQQMSMTSEPPPPAYGAPPPREPLAALSSPPPPASFVLLSAAEEMAVLKAQYKAE